MATTSRTRAITGGFLGGVRTPCRSSSPRPGRAIVALAMIALSCHLAWIRWRFFATGFLRSFVSIALGGVIIAGISAALGAVS